MTTTMQASRANSRLAMLSVLSVSLTAVLAAITHSYDFGPPAFIVGGIAIALLTALAHSVQRNGNRLALIIYALLNLWIIVGFGIVGGFWNHTVKAVLCAAHDGMLPPAMETWFMSPDLGSVAYETAGILTFVASLAAAVFGYQFVRSVHATRRGALS